MSQRQNQETQETFPSIKTKILHHQQIFHPPRRSLARIPFKKMDLAKATLTQHVISKGISMPSRKSKGKSEYQNRCSIVKSKGEKSECFDRYLSEYCILSDFKIMSHIGKGCFSVVSSACHKKTSKSYAVKTYQKIFSLDWHRLESIQREIKHLKRLQHPNIIELYHVFKDKRRLLLVMQNGGKQTLSGMLRKNKSFSQEKAKFYFRQILEGVRHSHSKGVCHRDLKPENVLVDDIGNVKIIDFGFSANCQNKLNTFCGTPPFMSPEITKKISYNGSSADIWALGVILYLLVVGYLPFKATNQAELFRLIQNGKYQIKESMSKNLRSILSKMLDCDERKRGTAESLVSDPWLLVE